jgi:hypothetical protein
MYVYADFIYDCISYFAYQRKQIYLIRIKFRFSILLMLLYWQTWHIIYAVSHNNKLLYL